MINTWSKFNYGHTVTADNQNIPFKEGAGPELVAVIELGNYTLGEYAVAVQAALNAAGALDYACAIDRSENLLVISGSNTFSLLRDTGSVLGTDAFEMMGFDYLTDLTGNTEYSGNVTCGNEYHPQFLLQSYVPKENFNESVGSTINESADGSKVEMVRFGTKQKIEMDIKFITNLDMDGQVIRNNEFGVPDALDFLNYITGKNRFEFVPDIETPATFTKVICDSMPGYSHGDGFKLKELFDKNLPGIFETGVIQLRVIT